MGKDDKFGFGHVVHVRHPKAIQRKKIKYMGLELTGIDLKFTIFLISKLT